jgi:hypothetical protein
MAGREGMKDRRRQTGKKEGWSKEARKESRKRREGRERVVKVQTRK